MTMVDIQNYIPPRPSEDITGALFGVGIEPMEIFVSVSIAASFMILVIGTFHPCVEVIGWFVFVPTVGIAMAVIVSMLGAIVNDLIPSVSFAVFLCNFL